MNPQRSNLQYFRWETYTDQKMIKSHGQHTQFNSDSQEESPPIPSIHGKAIPIISTAIRMVNENNTQSNAWRKKLVLCVDGRKMNYRPAINARERGRTLAQWLVKHFIPPSCMRKTNGQDLREWEETVPTS